MIKFKARSKSGHLKDSGNVSHSEKKGWRKPRRPTKGFSLKTELKEKREGGNECRVCGGKRRGGFLEFNG